MTIRHRLSRIFQPITIVSKTANLPYKDVLSKSQKLMLETGIIHQAHPGCFHFLPLGLRSLNKLLKIVDEEMFDVGGQKIWFPILTNSELWKLSGRLEDGGSELFTLKDRHLHSYILSPTHEESCSNLFSTVAPMSYKSFPFLLYQISSKFRDEMKPRFGLIRAREFLMKDMYSFDTTPENAKATYEKVCQSYDKVFRRIGVDFIKVRGPSGLMGGDYSHEYHYRAHIGDDKIFTCHSCNNASNLHLIEDNKCSKCGEEKNVSITNGIEVGHTFYLGTKYSKALGAKYIAKNGKPDFLEMGSYGIGLSRILAASVEVLSSETEMRWPDSLVPYSVVILPPKEGSKEHLADVLAVDKLHHTLTVHIPSLLDDILIDDRTTLTVGRRLLDAKRVGYRYVVIINKNSLQIPALFELNDLKSGVQLNLSQDELISYISNDSKKDEESVRSV